MKPLRYLPLFRVAAIILSAALMSVRDWMTEPILDAWDSPWEPVPRLALCGWLGFYAWFLWNAAGDTDGFLFIDNANLIVHEAGHALFGWFGFTMGIWGGAILQWSAPLLLALAFWQRRQTLGFVFCLFMLFENFLYTATYMADARAQELPLVSIGGSGEAMHDWGYIFASLGVLHLDTKIAVLVRAAGWCGMIAVMFWFGVRFWAAAKESVSQAATAQSSRF